MNTVQKIEIYGSLGRRTVALFLDALILLIPGFIFGQLIPVIGGVLVWFFYAPILEASNLRATVGKYLMGIQVTDVSGRRISFQASMIRNILKLFSSAILFIGYLFALFNDKKQTLHDLLADTVVVYGRSNQSLFDAWLERIQELFGTEFSRKRLARSNADELNRLFELKEKGALSEEEYQVEKNKILNKS